VERIGQTMRNGQLFGPGDLRVVETPVPVPATGEVVVRIHRYAPYGTDLGVYLNRSGRVRYPTGIGAELAGVIAAVGPAVSGWNIGDRVSALAMAHCGQCRNCRAGRTNLCLDESWLMAPRQECCADYARVMARKLARIPDGVSFDDAAMLGSIVDALNACDMMRPRLGETFAVVGVGAMGWGAVAVAKAKGCRVIAIGGTGETRPALAKAVGADEIIPITRHDEDVTERFRALCPQGADCIMETSASDWGVRQCFGLTAIGARIALTGGGPIPATAWNLVHHEIAVFGVRAGHHQDQALALLAQGLIDLKPTITHRFSLDQAPDAFRLLTGPDARNVGRVMIEAV
jgi:threonine dehydrogenase-like Zn-dependent dehydrogenase